MMIRRAIPAAAVLAMLISPLTAHAVFMGTVTTEPAQQAPALTLPLIAVLAIALAAIAAYRLRAAGTFVGLILLAAVTGLAGIGYATLGLTVSGGECGKKITQPFLQGQTLTNECPTGILILAINLDCNGDPPAPSNPCRVGETLASGQTCTLPHCTPG